MRLLPRALAAAATLAVALAIAPPVHAQWPNDGRALCTATGDQSNAVMTSDGSGGAIVAWEDRRGGASDIYVTRLRSNGGLGQGWSPNGTPLCTSLQDQVAPAIVSDGVGGAYVAWEDYRAGGANPDIYVQRVTAAGAVASGWPVNGLDLCTLTSVQGRPTIVRDGSGGAIVAWEDFRNGPSDIFAQRVSAAGAAQWTVSGIALCTASGDQRFPVAVSDGAGGAIVAWEDGRVDDGDVYAQRVTAAGAPQWAAGGAPASAAAFDQIAVRAASDGAGGVLLSWEDHRDGNSDIYAQRLNASGVRQWALDGLALCTDVNEQYSAVIAGDGAGGAFVAWVDLRSLTSSDIYAQHATAGGAIAGGWLANGDSVCASMGNQFDPVIAPDDAGGAFIAWDDPRQVSGQTDVYAMRLTGGGSIASGWNANGKVWCGATGDQFVSSLIADGAGGALLGWSDQRNGAADVYGIRLTGNGSAPTVDVPPVPWVEGPRLLASPNPLRLSTRLEFALATESTVSASIVDVSGRVVRVLLDGETLPAGPHTVDWNGRDGEGARLPAGVYLALLRAGAEPPRVEKLVLLP